jgi:hypothetical protein
MTQAINEHTPTPPSLTSGKTALSISATIDRLKQIVAEAGDHLLLGDGPPQPDHELLDICADLLHMQKHAAAARKIWFDDRSGNPKAPAARAEADILDGQIASLVSKARKLKATTAAGVYAKALVMRASRSGMPQLALSLANDLVDVPSLRASIWPNEGDQAHG